MTFESILRSARRPVILAVLVVLVAAFSAVRPSVGRATACSDDWPMFRHDPLHQGVSCETTLGASNAPSLKLDWSVGTGATSYSSPAVVYNATLGESLVYVGNQGGQMNAYDATSGGLVWSYQVPKTAGLSKEIETSPEVYNNVVYFGAGDYHEYALNATTGTLICTSPSAGGIIAGSTVVGNPDGVAGHDVVYYADSGPSGSASDGGHQWAMWAVGDTGGAQCTTRWVLGAFPGQSGVYSTQAYGSNQSGTPVVVFGTTDPDDAVYALDARTGSQLWRFQTQQGIDSDVGAPPTISPPGVNRLADGAVYVTGKDGITYAIDLSTGQQIWDYTAIGHPAQSGASLVGRTIYLGFSKGLIALDAVTGAQVWTSASSSSPSVSMPSISGATGDQVIFRGDMAGVLHADSLASGASLFTYPTAAPGSGVFIFSSPAISTGRVFIANSAGTLFAFGLNANSPSISSVSPTAGPTSGGTAVTISGSAFQAGAAVTFGSSPATGVRVLGSSTIVATSPAGSGTVAVTVTNPDGTSASLSNAFTYVVGLTCHTSTGSPSGQPTVLSGRPYTGGSDAVGVAQGATNAYFAEGYTGTGFQEYLTVQNPGA
ncbi:MAG: PQQ-binding-like beta-propeller repeat protein, partial [Candidatus Dormibacterales bacterium]